MNKIFFRIFCLNRPPLLDFEKSNSTAPQLLTNIQFLFLDLKPSLWPRNYRVVAGVENINNNHQELLKKRNQTKMTWAKQKQGRRQVCMDLRRSSSGFYVFLIFPTRTGKSRFQGCAVSRADPTPRFVLHNTHNLMFERKRWLSWQRERHYVAS